MENNSFLEMAKLIGPKLRDWEGIFKLFADMNEVVYVLENPIGLAPVLNSPTAVRNAYQRHVIDLLDVRCLMLATMTHALQVNYMDIGAFDCNQSTEGLPSIHKLEPKGSMLLST
ncbi:hypothetical protein Tco_0433270 [Tanacetum coccineum]